MSKLVTLVLVLAASLAQAQTIQLSPYAQVSLITCGPSQAEVYTAFGHSAIRVYDPVNHIDDAYNYGVFDFDQPNFYLNYTRGLLLYKLGVYAYPDFRDIYIYYNRSVTEQVLNVTPSQKQALYDYLELNARPENETYRYDYFYNNCATKVRDAFVEVLGDSLHFDDSFITTSYTIRELTSLYLTHQPWGDLGIDLCLGLPMDKHATPYEYMYLPDYVESFSDRATVDRNGVREPFVKNKMVVYYPRPQEIPKSPVHPWVVFGGFLAITLIISILDWRRRKATKIFDFILFNVMGAVGILLLILWLATDHKAAAENFNILWALPTHVFAVVLFRNKSTAFLKKYFRIAMLITAFTVATWFILPQEMNNFLLPLASALGLRAFILWKLL